MSDAEADLALRRWDTERDGPPTEAKLRALLEARGMLEGAAHARAIDRMDPRY